MPWSVSTSTMILEVPGYSPPVHHIGASSGMLTGVALRPVILISCLPLPWGKAYHGAMALAREGALRGSSIVAILGRNHIGSAE